MRNLITILFIFFAITGYSQTTFYLESSGAIYGANGTVSTWTNSSGVTRWCGLKTGFKKSSTIASTTIAVDNSSGTASTVFGQFISPALNAQTISGTVTSYARASIANATGATTQVCIKITVI